MRILRFLLGLTIALSPLYILRGLIELPFLNFYLPYTFLELLILTSIASTIIYFIATKQKFSILRTHFELPILLFTLSALVSVFVSFDFWGGLGIFKAYFLEPVLFYYCLVFVIKKSSNQFVLFGLFASSFWLGLLGLIQKFTGSYSFAPIEIAQGRITAVYNSANALAMFLCPISILSISQYIKNKSSQKLIYLLIFIFVTVIIFLTKSRGGMVSLVISLSVFIYFLITLKIKLLKRNWFIGPIIILLGLTIFLYQFYLNYNFFKVDWTKPYTEGDTLQIRFFIWAGTINMLKDHPVTGAGLNGFKTLYTNQYRLPLYQEQFQYPHNLILTIWTETGIYGMASFTLLNVLAYSLIIRKIYKHKNPVLGAGIAGVLSYILLHGLVDVPYFKNDLSLEYWTIIALLEGWALSSNES
jgi:putative inorganic carbon (hco3(-)) transporter